MLRANDPVVDFKLSFLQRVLPCEHIAVYGDMYIVEGGYTEYCAKNGATRATLVDTLETRGWQETRLRQSNIDFYKGDFANAAFMRTVPDTFSAAVAYDVLLHQPALLHTLNLMLQPVEHDFVVVQPMLEETDVLNTLVFLPGNEDRSLYPLASSHAEYQAFSTEEVNQTNWIWGITPSFLRAALVSEGFEVVHEDFLAPFPNPRWSWRGFHAERRRRLDHRHWSQMRATPLLHPGWNADGSLIEA